MKPSSTFIIFALQVAKLCTQNADEDIKIIGGKNVSIEEYPHHAAFDTGVIVDVSKSLITYKYFCGGTVIADQWLLTAAHCFQDEYGRIKAQFNALVGTDDVDDRRDHFRLVKSLSLRKNFLNTNRPPTNKNDIALVKLTERLNLSEKVQIISLPEKGEDECFFGKNVTLTGFGYYSTNNATLFQKSRNLKAVNLTLFTAAKCEKIFGIILFNRSQHLCAGSVSADRGACFGDSGGGLVARRANGSFVLLGVVARIQSFTCKGQSATPLFTRVYPHTEWINHWVK